MFARAIAALWAAVVALPMRAWVAAAVIALTWRIIELVAANPALLQDSSFMQLVTPIAGAGGFLLIVAFLFASSKGEADKTEALRDNARSMVAAGIPVGSRRASDGDPHTVDRLDVKAETVTVEQRDQGQ